MILEPSIPIDKAYDIIVGKLRSFFESAHKTDAVLGLSGGIDSAVVAALAADALGSNHVHGILLPSGFSTSHSVKDAEELAVNLGISFETISISGIYDAFMESLQGLFSDTQWHVAQENIQARIRGTILMAHSNKSGALLLNTSNKSEISMGYGTLYGDLAGALMVIADLYKLQVYELAEYINRNGELIPLNTITKAPSAELRPGQQDSDSLPPYNVLDPVLHALNDEGIPKEDLLNRGADTKLIERILSLKNGSSFKVMQIPPVLTVTGKPLVPAFKCI